LGESIKNCHKFKEDEKRKNRLRKKRKKKKKKCKRKSRKEGLYFAAIDQGRNCEGEQKITSKKVKNNFRNIIFQKIHRNI
jgi:hypothetical protein